MILYLSIYLFFLYFVLKEGRGLKRAGEFFCLFVLQLSLSLTKFSSKMSIKSFAASQFYGAKFNIGQFSALNFSGSRFAITDKVHFNKSLITAFSDLKMSNFAIFFAALFFVFAMVRKCCFLCQIVKIKIHIQIKVIFFQQGAPSGRSARSMFKQLGLSNFCSLLLQSWSLPGNTAIWQSTRISLLGIGIYLFLETKTVKDICLPDDQCSCFTTSYFKYKVACC